MYSSRGSTSTSCAPSSCTNLRTSSLKIAVGTGSSLYLQCLPEYPSSWGTPQALRGRVDPAPQPPVLALRDRKQVLPVNPYRGAAGEAKPSGLLVAVDRDHFHLGLQPLFGQDRAQGRRRRLVRRASVEVQNLYLHLLRLMAHSPRGVGCSSRALPERRRPVA